jgi:hypothetical protein
MPKQLPRSPLDFDPQIVDVRGQRVMLDETLAELYGVPTKVFNQAVRRNRARFPPDFLLEVDAEEWKILRSQIVTLRFEHGRHRKYLPLAFTEHGAIMAATILNSPRAIQMSALRGASFRPFPHDTLHQQGSRARTRCAQAFGSHTRCGHSTSVRSGIRSNSEPDVGAGREAIAQTLFMQAD